MNRSKVIAWLDRANGARELIAELQEAYDGALYIASKTTKPLTGVSVQSSKTSYDDANAKVAEYGRRLSNAMDELARILLDTDKVIGQVKRNDLRTLLYARYVNGKPWESVAESVNTSESTVYRRLHFEALDEVGKILAKK